MENFDCLKHSKHFQSKSSIIWCNQKQICKKISYPLIWDVSREIYRILLGCIPETNICFGLLLDKSVYLPSVIISLHSLRHTFVYIKNATIESISSKLQIEWIISQTNLEDKNQYYVFKTLQLLSGDVIYILRNNKITTKCSLSFENVFCVVQTSGTTGENKIVRVTNACIEDNVLSLRSHFKLTNTDVIFWGTPLTFDPSLIEILLALICKCTIVIVPSYVYANPNFLFDALFTIGKVTFLQMVPSVFFRWSKKQVSDIVTNSSLKCLAFGGENFSQNILNFNWKNNLRLFNLYGVTELSCWATIYEMRDEKYGSKVPIGVEIGDTIVLIKDEHGVNLSNGCGEIFLGSKSRYCLINDESLEEKTKSLQLISTGDLVEINDNGIFYIGRKNSIVKRLGHNVNLSLIEKIISEEIGLQNKCVYSEKLSKILAFILSENPKDHDKYYKTKLLDKIRVKLVHSISESDFPDFIDLLPQFPLTNHGKIDSNGLEKLYINSIQKVRSSKSPMEIFLNLWCKYLGLSLSMEFVQSGDYLKHTFFEMGGNSIFATQLLSEFIDICNVEFPKELVTKLFESNLDECVECLKKLDNPRKRKLPIEIDTPDDGISSDKPEFNEHLIEPVKVNWKYDLKACVDSTALAFKKGENIFIASGSFSHIFAILMEDGKEYYKITLPDVTESRPALTPCQTCILIGCFNGAMYCINFHEKELQWTYFTGNKIKCTPCFCLDGCAAVFGSYDNYVHCISIKDGNEIWKTNVNGSVTSDPFYEVSKKFIFVATLKGSIYCLNENSGTILWQYHCEVPVFASPCYFDESAGVAHSIVWIDVQGKLHNLATSGEKKWDLEVSGHVFGSLVAHDNKHVYFGSTDNYLYKINIHEKLVKKLPLGSSISTTPCVSNRQNGVLVSACNSGYLYIIDIRTFKILKVFQMPAETFSSPVVFENKIYVGCRDNFLYCIDF